VEAVGEHEVGGGDGFGVARAHFVDVGVFAHAHDADDRGVLAGDLADHVVQDGGGGDDGDALAFAHAPSARPAAKAVVAQRNRVSHVV